MTTRGYLSSSASKLAGEQALASMFVGASCTLCTDPAWTVEQRGL